METAIKTSFLKGAAFAAGAAAFLALGVIIAQSVHTFTAGEVVSASKINENFQIAAPEGAIMAFYLSACPSGWVAADGTNSTPDLRGRFVRGRDDAGTGAAGIDPGGVRAIGNEQTDAFQGHRHTMGGYSPVAASGGNTALGPLDPGGAPTPAYNINIGPFTLYEDNGGGTPRTAAETRPRNVALIYCMRKDS